MNESVVSSATSQIQLSSISQIVSPAEQREQQGFASEYDKSPRAKSHREMLQDKKSYTQLSEKVEKKYQSSKVKVKTSPVQREQDDEVPMELDEATKERLKNIEKEVFDHVYSEPAADGILGNDSKSPDNPNDMRSESMKNQNAGNNQSRMLSKYFDENAIPEEESYRPSEDITFDHAKDSTMTESLLI